jgi:hypothetical protein
MYEQVTMGLGEKSEGVKSVDTFYLICSRVKVRLNVSKSAEILIVQENN